MTDKEFVDDMRTYRLDHLPDGWPAVQTQQIDRLIAIINQLTIERDEVKKTRGYSCHVCGALRQECEIMKRTANDTAERCIKAVTIAGAITGGGYYHWVHQAVSAIKRECGLSD